MWFYFKKVLYQDIIFLFLYLDILHSETWRYIYLKDSIILADNNQTSSDISSKARNDGHLNLETSRGLQYPLMWFLRGFTWHWYNELGGNIDKNKLLNFTKAWNPHFSLNIFLKYNYF